MSKKTVFISYSWDNEEHKDWVASLALQLEKDGIKVTLDQFDTKFGDQLPQFMERAISENEFVLIICSPKYKNRSDNRTGGVGYEGNIINGEIFRTQKHQKFIPILRIGDENTAIPVALDGKKYVDLRGNSYKSNYKSLLNSVSGKSDVRTSFMSRLGNFFAVSDSIPKEVEASIVKSKPDQFEPIKILEVIAKEISDPRNDGTRGSGLYKVPLRLSKTPTNRWKDLFVYFWNNPPYFTTMHRPGIVECHGNKVILNGTTIEEVEGVHKRTLVEVLNATNRACEQEFNAEKEIEKAKRELESQHKKKAEEIAKRIKFE